MRRHDCVIITKDNVQTLKHKGALVVRVETKGDGVWVQWAKGFGKQPVTGPYRTKEVAWRVVGMELHMDLSRI